MSINFEKELNREQWEAVKNGNGHCLVLAGAGSGKTRTIVYRVAYLLSQGVLPEQIMLLTFTNKAAREMITRVNDLLGMEVRGMWAGTFHHVANRLLRSYASEVGFTSSFSILDQEDSKDLIRRSMKDLQFSFSKDSGHPSPAVIQSWVSYAANSRRSLASVVEERSPFHMNMIDQITRVGASYAHTKQAMNAMDFDDLLIKTGHLLRGDGSRRLSSTGEYLSSRIHYVLVDEYQDTNLIQADIVDALSTVHKNLFVVGDDAQSIYSFRAATIKNILGFPEMYKEAKVFKLETNYRSTPEIIDVANEVIAHNPEQYQKTLMAVLDSREKPVFVSASDTAQEASFITRTIKDIQSQGVKLSHMAVLFRASFHSQALEIELARNGIEYDYRGGLRFFERAHIKDVAAFCLAYLNPKDELSWGRILRLYEGIGEAAAQTISQYISSIPQTIDSPDAWRNLISMTSAEQIPARARSGWQQFLKLWQTVLLCRTPHEIIVSFLEQGYRTYALNEFPDARERIDDVIQFSEFARRYETLGELTAEIALQESFTGRWDYDRQPKLVLSTIHQAKGLEWDTVFVINVAENAFPSSRAAAEGALAEERRLFYVAITRAQKRLYLTMPAMGGQWGSFQQQSQFIDEIPNYLFEKVNLVPDRSFGFADAWSDSQDSGWYAPRTKKNSVKSKTTYKANTSNTKKKTLYEELSYESEEEAIFIPKKPGTFLPDVDEL